MEKLIENFYLPGGGFVVVVVEDDVLVVDDVDGIEDVFDSLVISKIYRRNKLIIEFT